MALLDVLYDLAEFNEFVEIVKGDFWGAWSEGFFQVKFVLSLELVVSACVIVLGLIIIEHVQIK